MKPKQVLIFLSIKQWGFFPTKNFQNNFQKPIDKSYFLWYNIYNKEREGNTMKTRIELTDEVIKAITMCCPLAHDDNTELCDTHCALAGACLEYYTGDDSQNKGRETK